MLNKCNLNIHNINRKVTTTIRVGHRQEVEKITEMMMEKLLQYGIKENESEDNGK